MAPVQCCVGSLRVKWHWPGTVRCKDGAWPLFAHIGQAPNNFGIKFKSYDVWKARGTFENLLTIRAMPVLAPADDLWVELPPVRNDVYLQKYILHLHRYFTSEDQKYRYEGCLINSWNCAINQSILNISFWNLAMLFIYPMSTHYLNFNHHTLLVL